jgi:photosystem II stability/assembly factor-like uncharacterized protein
VARLLAATGDAIARLDEERDGWRVSVALEGTRAQCLVRDPNDATVVYAGCHGNGLWKSEDDAESWTDLSLAHPDVFSVAVSPADGTLYAGCEPSMLFASTNGGQTWRELEALRALPSAPTWSFPPRPWTSHVRWIAPSPHQGGLLLVGIELGGLMRSEDGGETWEDHRPGAQRDVHALAWHPHASGRAYEAAGGGATWSSDGGESWEPADAGRDRHYTWALAVDPDDPESWYVSASPGPMQAHRAGRAQAYIYRWRGEGPWERLEGGLPQPLDAMPYALAWMDGRLCTGLADGRLYVSYDRGDTWEEQTLRGDLPPRIVALAA